MSEARLQASIVRQFGETYPEQRGRFFSVKNENAHKNSVARGIVPGVADMHYIRDLSKGNLYMELKYPGRKHDRDHVQVQVNWGRLMESLGHRWRLVTTLEQAMNLIEDKCDAGLTVDQVQKIVDKAKLDKTNIIF